jgi:hypothetical protein
MQIELTAMQPILEQKSKETEEMMETLSVDKASAEIQ